MLNKIIVVGEIITAPTIGVIGDKNLKYARFKVEVKNKNNQKPDSFFAMAWGSKAKIADEVNLGDLVYLDGSVKLSSFRNDKQELIYFQEIKIDNYFVISKNYNQKNNYPNQNKKNVEVNEEQLEKLFGDWMRKQKENS